MRINFIKLATFCIFLFVIAWTTYISISNYNPYPAPIKIEDYPPPLSVAIAIMTIDKPTSKIYPTIASVQDTLKTNKLMSYSNIHIFNGGESSSHIEFLKYSKNIQFIPINMTELNRFNESIHARSSYNYARILSYMAEKYSKYSGILVLEDDVILDPNASSIIKDTLEFAYNQTKNFLVDGYIASFYELGISDAIASVTEKEYQCCTQSYLYSPSAANFSAESIMKGLTGEIEFQPYDFQITYQMFLNPDMFVFNSNNPWVQHIGKPAGLGFLHRGHNFMKFED